MRIKSLLTLFFIVLFGMACSKKNNPEEDPEARDKNNEFHALVVFSPDSTDRFDVTGRSATMGCTLGGTSVSGLREDSVYINLSLGFPDAKCLSSAGTFTTELRSEYKTNLYELDRYENHPARPGSITFTTLTTEFTEGHFETVCFISATDSVIITGTFKGAFVR